MHLLFDWSGRLALWLARLTMVILGLLVVVVVADVVVRTALSLIHISEPTRPY